MNRYILYFLTFILIITGTFGAYNYKINKVYAGQELQNAQADRARLESELAALEKEIAQKQKELASQKGQSTSLSRDIAVLTTQISKAKLDIQAKNLTIKKLGGEIIAKSKTINVLNTKIDNIKESLAQLIRKNREIDDKSILALVLSNDNLSDAYGDIDAFSSIKKSINKSVDEIRGVKTLTEEEKAALEQKKNKEVDTKMELESVKQQVEKNEKDKQQLLSISKNKEAEYQKVLDAKAKRKAQILAALFNLRDNAAIPFGKALEYANLAYKATGVKPAFILAILSRESNLGTDQGSCYVTNMDTGAGVHARSGKTFPNVMKPMGLTGRRGDIYDFIQITSETGRDPLKTLVSCPIGGYGYGGAMGPSQILPTTWQGLKSKVASYLGIRTPDPWYARDAIMATGVYLAQKGGSGDSYTSQRTAACNYYAGSGGCPTITSKSSRQQIDTVAYGNWVMSKTNTIQTTMIDPLQD